uniref:KAP family P-loop NTPase fold protein n=1 Tax=Phocaeicola salanitronis TaxID=376805 RepID=UPI0023F7F4A5
MKRLINRLTDYRYLRMMFKKLLDNIGRSPLTWLSCITILLSFFIFDSFWVTWINKIWVDPIASQIKDNTWWIIVIYSIVMFAYYYHNLKETEVINMHRCQAVFIGTFLYCICLFSGKWDYVLICDCCRYLAWSNFIFIVPIFWESYIYYQLKHKKVAESVKPELEIEKTNNVADSYKRKAVCESAYKTLESCFYKEGSFTFSITGIWGSGKTTFMNILKEQYSRNNSAKSVIIFEPWKSDTSDSIVKGFFAMLRDELSNYIPNISSTIDQYVELLLDEESGKPLKIIGKSLHGIFNEDKNPYELIKEILERTKHKTVVFIDDIDRLNAAEIKEVLRLIRNTANFPYIQFIVAYDKNYVCEVLKNNGINTPERYLEKFFNVEMALPKSEERVICNELLTRIQGTINAIWGVEGDDLKITNMVYYRPDDPTNSIINNNLVTQVLFTVRDVIRFHNSFYLLAKAYKDQKLENEVCFQDLFFLELLRYRYLDIYTILCNKPFVLLQLSDYVFSLNEDYEKTLQEYLGNTQIEIVSDILGYLFKDRGKTNAIYSLRSYYKYFMYRLDDKILTVDEFMSLAKRSDSEIIESANQLYKNKYKLEFENQIGELLVQIYKSNGEDRGLDYTVIYNLLERLSKSDIRNLRNEIYNAIIPHLQQLRCIDNRHFKALLHLYDVVDFNLSNVKLCKHSKKYTLHALWFDCNFAPAYQSNR